ncbi:MAG: HAMP domain-containing protein, partial [Prevotella sp.]|nr:HAMP domain-containing protein [Prevotella sp.]
MAYAPNRLPEHPYCMPIAANYGTVSHYFSDKELNGEYVYEDWYIATSIEGISFWTDPYYNMLDTPVVSYAVPIISEDHGFEGVLTLAVELTNLNNLLAFRQENGTDSLEHSQSISIILDRNTTFLSTPHTEYIMNETLFTLAESKNDTLHNYMGREIVANRDGEEVMNINGEKSVVSWRVLPKLQWTAMVITPYSEIFASLNQLTYITIIVALIAVIAAIIFLYSSVRRALRPIKRLKSATQLLGEGKYDTELPYRLTSRQDEIGDLGREFMRMEKAVKSNIDQLEEERKRVKDSYVLLDTLIHNVISHLRLPINNMISFVDALSSFVGNNEETQMLKDEAKKASITILQQFNQLNQMANLVGTRENNADTMVISSEEFIEDAMKGVHQLEERFLLTINEEYQDKRSIKICTNTLALETLLFQLIVE